MFACYLTTSDAWDARNLFDGGENDTVLQLYGWELLRKHQVQVNCICKVEQFENLKKKMRSTIRMFDKHNAKA